ncbi:hypothetical protein V7S43_006383 [Phytophthora oleae]|uniref:Uncharacterized protein n=1 Tax=Phytophthora oleae TaxID=2107226 RepID=A0ABD3FRG6_9STRA
MVEGGLADAGKSADIMYGASSQKPNRQLQCIVGRDSTASHPGVGRLKQPWCNTGLQLNKRRRWHAVTGIKLAFRQQHIELSIPLKLGTNLEGCSRVRKQR